MSYEIADRFDMDAASVLVADFMASIAGTDSAETLSQYNDSALARAACALATSAQRGESLSRTYISAGRALNHGIAETAENAKIDSRSGFAFASELANFDGMVKIGRSDYYRDSKTRKWVNGSRKTFVAGKSSRVAALIRDNSGAGLGLSAVQFSDYGADGFNADGDSMFLSGTHRAENVSAVTVAGLNAVQSQTYRANDSLRAAVSIFAKLADSADAVTAAMRKTDSDYASDLVRHGKIERGSHEIGTESVSALAAQRYSDGAAFIVDNGSAFVRYAIDKSGRQYAVGTFNHFDSAVLCLVIGSRSIASDKLEKIGLTVDDAVSRIRRFIAGDAKSLTAFAKRDTFVIGSKTVVRSNFNFAAFAAAVYFFSLS